MRLRQRIAETVIQRNALILWQIEFRAYSEDAPEYFALLDNGEKKRLVAYRHGDKALAFTIAHAFIRLLLGELLDILPQDLRFKRGDYGKPFLLQAPDLPFSLAYGESYLLFAHAESGQVGVDIEKLRYFPQMNAIVEQQFHPHERAALARFEADEQLRHFFRLWTCKEAYIKALGTALATPLNSFAVDLCEPIGIKGQSDWLLHEFQLAHEHRAAIAVNQRKAVQHIYL